MPRTTSYRATFLIVTIVTTLFNNSHTVVFGVQPLAGLDIGVNYGMTADNLPPASDVINLYVQNKITKIRLFDPNPAALQALRGTGILVSLGMKNDDIPNVASGIEAATQWYETNILPYQNDILWAYITVGNEVQIPGPSAGQIVPAMRNLRSVLDNHNLKTLFVTTVVPTTVLGTSFPPSAADFSPEAKPTLVGIVQFLSETNAPLMVNVYPYFAYASDPVNVRLDYAQFTATEPVVRDGNLSYYNLFDAICDAFTWAIEKQGVKNVGITVSETGWPSAGNGEFTTPGLAETYNKNLLKHVMGRVGTPKRPGAYVDTFIFAIFNEDLKPAGIEQNWGLFYPNLQPVYQIFN